VNTRRSCLRRAVLAVVAAAGLAGAATAASAAPPTLVFSVFARTAHQMDSVVWTGKQFLYVENTANTVWAAPAAGSPVTQFASMPKLVEETRCVVSPGTHGFAPGVIFCASPDDKIYRIGADGSTTVFASLPVPYPPASDGALAVDNVGRFGYRLVAATGRSGSGQPPGGDVFAIGPAGTVVKIGSYGGPGGADEIAIAPAGFGSAGGEALLTTDPGAGGGALVAMDAGGKTREIATFSDGPNPVVPIPSTAASPGKPAPGIYLTDDTKQLIYFAPAAELARYAGDVLVGTETKAQFWIVEPHGNGFTKVSVRHNLRGGKYSLEGAVFVP
jgi:hypothetical protein